jgi:hypothetical protein
VVRMSTPQEEAPVKYLFTIYTDESKFGTLGPEEGAQMTADYNAFTESAREAGVLLGGDGLQPTATATTIRVRDGERLLTDGPFAETREQLAGYYLLELDSIDEALAWGARIPGAAHGSVEVRPVMVYDAASAPALAAEQTSS